VHLRGGYRVFVTPPDDQGGVFDPPGTLMGGAIRSFAD
jgi:hypothetical protein